MKNKEKYNFKTGDLFYITPARKYINIDYVFTDWVKKSMGNEECLFLALEDYPGFCWDIKREQRVYFGHQTSTPLFKFVKN